MSHQLTQLAGRIRVELVELEQVQDRIQAGWQRVQQTSDEYYLDGVALNLHSFYSGLERIFELVASRVDGSLPAGENWHQLLLQQMTAEIPGIRPAVISGSASNQLDEYRGFRHVVRNVYTFRFEPAKIQKLVDNVAVLFPQVQAELLAFAEFLEVRSSTNS
ncbi:MAG: hypothetical protein FOGNACKC_03213 [Anaerolineae bacterium]|nr:hypothetical protein [Anaerolineae bacterium]